MVRAYTKYVQVRITKLYRPNDGQVTEEINARLTKIRSCFRSEMSRRAGESLFQASGPATENVHSSSAL